jgi:cellulose synthase/poly-beta-1,6-N-acetylglucosamine synthase-like glycosyltransferase
MTFRQTLKKIVKLISWLVTGILLLFTVRRWLFIFFALKKNDYRLKLDRAHSKSSPAHILLLVPVRNEASTLPGLLHALDNLVYSYHKLTIVFISDGSTDNGELLLQSWITPRANWHLLSLAQNVGKANALNAALAAFSKGEIVVIYDADERPQPTALKYLAEPFIDSRVGGVSGQRAVSNSLASPAASYTAFEGLVHQLITMRAKDRLGLAPAILGSNCAYRRSALAEVGGFKPAALLEDSDLTLKLARAGWTTQFEPRAVSYHRVPETISGYWRQHTRWARGFNEVAREQGGVLMFDHQLPFSLRLELLAFSLGYLDRLALLAGLGLALTKNRWVTLALAISLLIPFLQVVAVLKIAREPAAMWGRAIWLPFFLGLDIAMAVAGFWNTWRGMPQIWEERQDRDWKLGLTRGRLSP